MASKPRHSSEAQTSNTACGSAQAARNACARELARESRIPRARLLDATLDGLGRDFHDQRVRWFVALHELLEPTPSDQAGFAKRLPRASWAVVTLRRLTLRLKILRQLDKAELIDPAALVVSIAPAVQARTKGSSSTVWRPMP